MKCWICGSEAESGEHLIKASDLKAIFGRVAQDAPIYFHATNNKNNLIKGLKSDKLKYRSRLCEKCNNQRTQEHDKAWAKLSEYLRHRNPPPSRGTKIDLGKVFPGAVRKSILNVHLYFIKQFGCLISENNIPMDISEFSFAILNNEAHPKVHLALWSGLSEKSIKQVGRSHVQTAALGNKIVYAGWFYILDNIAVNVIYSESTQSRKGLIDAWHPSTVKKIIKVAGT